MLIKKILGTKNERTIKKYKKLLKKINSIKESLTTITDKELISYREAHKTDQPSQSNNGLMIESIAVACEGIRRTLGKEPYDTQIIGALGLINGNIAEMKTGEGKTLVGPIASYYLTLTGSVHLVTVNDYLAERDENLNRPFFDFFNIKSSSIIQTTPPESRISAYSGDIIYTTSHELGFDYLRDHLAKNYSETVQRKKLTYAIIDEADSVLIDEARTPLVISGPTQTNPADYEVAEIVCDSMTIGYEKDEKDNFEDGIYVGSKDVIVDPKHKTIFISEAGFGTAEIEFKKLNIVTDQKGLYHRDNLYWTHLLRSMLIAKHAYFKDIDYIVNEEGEIDIIDQNTGRIMKGRRWGDGIHQSIEQKEKVEVRPENINLASISIQNYFRLYQQLAGMTGTADTEAHELNMTYGLDVVVVPTQKPSMRVDEKDKLFLTKDIKIKYIIEDIKDCFKRGQPALVGTNSVEMSEMISKKLKAIDIPHNVLNAKQHRSEAEIIAEAGKKGRITIGTNMAGRGTDIILGGTDGTIEDKNEILSLGGLRVIGTERNDSRRIDNQLIGRSGRQGDKGSSIFYLSVDDKLLKYFLDEKQINFIRRIGVEEDEALSGNIIDKMILKAQIKVDGIMQDSRRTMLEFDDVINEQRKVVYNIREQMIAENGSKIVADYSFDLINQVLDQIFKPSDQFEDSEHQLERIVREISDLFQIRVNPDLIEGNKILELRRTVTTIITGRFQDFSEIFGEESLSELAQIIYTQASDNEWAAQMEHLSSLRDGIHLQGYVNKSPKMVFKEKGYESFRNMISRINNIFLANLFININIMIDQEVENNVDGKNKEAV